MIHDASELIYPPVLYERRLLFFFDYLGWREEILAAEIDGRKIARLAAALRMVSDPVISPAARLSGARWNSFSDNVVLSTLYDPSTVQDSLRGMAAIQIGAACTGILVRGAVTVGDVFHDGSIVFGPALNRAAALEKEAIYPRVVLDPQTPELRDQTAIFLDQDEGFAFFNPFSVEAFDHLLAATRPDPAMIQRFNDQTGAYHDTGEVVVPSRLTLEMLHQRFSREAALSSDERVKIKLAWLVEKIRAGLI